MVGVIFSKSGIKSNIDMYLKEIVDASGTINIEKMDDIRLAIQKGTFSTENIRKRMSDLV